MRKVRAQFGKSEQYHRNFLIAGSGFSAIGKNRLIFCQFLRF
jgi:hypothetical protein